MAVDARAPSSCTCSSGDVQVKVKEQEQEQDADARASEGGVARIVHACRAAQVQVQVQVQGDRSFWYRRLPHPCPQRIIKIFELSSKGRRTKSHRILDADDA